MKTKKYLSLTLVSFSLIFLWAFSSFGSGGAPGEPGVEPYWSYAGKTGMGTSYEQYLNNNAYGDNAPTGIVSKVWFTIAQGIITETSYGMIHEAQIRDLQFLVTGNGFFDEEKVATNSKIEYLYTDSEERPLSLAYRVINTDKEDKYKIEKHIFTDPNRQTLFMRVIFTANETNVTPYILINPYMNTTGYGDVAYVTHNYLNAREGSDKYLSLKCTIPFTKASAGFVGHSDGWTDLNDNHNMDWEYDWADNGNVAMMAKLPTLNNETKTFDIVVGFGKSHVEAVSQADGTIQEGYQAVLDKYNGVGNAIGWEDYIQGLSDIQTMIPLTGDNGKLLYSSALVLKALEDKTHAGALVASISIPWGNTISAKERQTGYRAVWPRDFYQCAMALLAVGDTQTPLVSFKYLEKIQVTSDKPYNEGATGWFLQKTPVDGQLEWVGVQMDQAAMPIMLGWKLWEAGILSNGDVSTYYNKMLKPAAEFLSNGGKIKIRHGNGVNEAQITPPWTQQERWEEQAGYSPSTTAAIITGLISAADIAKNVGYPEAAAYYELKADLFASNLERYMYTKEGSLGNGQYYLRISKSKNPNEKQDYDIGNGGGTVNSKEILDAGFLELVRYGVKPANNEHIASSLSVLDDISLSDVTRVKYNFKFEGSSGPDFPGWRRYGHDGYGEKTNDGSNYRGGDSTQRGRVWPIFTGERGHYELEKVKTVNNEDINSQIKKLRDTYVKTIEYFANEGLMIPEQVWDGVGGNSTYSFELGEGTNSATPLAWSHAEYVKLVRSLADENTWDSYSIVKNRYAKYKKTSPQIFFRGTPNNWGITSMVLIADYTWQIDVIFGNEDNERFKFDVYGDWSHNYGDNPAQDSIADQNGADITILGGTGSYTITFNDQTKKYSIVKN